MILTDLYIFEHLSQKSKTRIDCTASTGSYDELEQLRNKKSELFLYFGKVPPAFQATAKSKADFSLTKTKSLSSVYFVRKSPNIAQGDMKDTTDGFIFNISDDLQKIEVFIARGRKKDIVHLANLFADGELTEEIERLKAATKPETKI